MHKEDRQIRKGQMRGNDSSGEEVKEEQGNQEGESEKYRYHRAKGERGERREEEEG